MNESKELSHLLLIDGHKMGVYHFDRRMYRFGSWKSTKPKLEIIVLSRIQEVSNLTGELVFSRVIPMRKTRLGNFFLQMEFKLKNEFGEELADEKDLNLVNLYVDSFETLDPEEIKSREEITRRQSFEQYSQEYRIRRKAFDSWVLKNPMEFNSNEEIKEFIESLMESEGWDSTADNRMHKRLKRVFPLEY